MRTLRLARVMLAGAQRGTPPIQCSDWLVTQNFYAALHLVAALAETDNETHEGHEDRNEYVNRRLRPAFSAYRRLSDKSRDARYDGRLFSVQELAELRGHFATVRDNVARPLGRAGCDLSDVNFVMP